MELNLLSAVIKQKLNIVEVSVKEDSNSLNFKLLTKQGLALLSITKDEKLFEEIIEEVINLYYFRLTNKGI